MWRALDDETLTSVYKSERQSKYQTNYILQRSPQRRIFQSAAAVIQSVVNDVKEDVIIEHVDDYSKSKAIHDCLVTHSTDWEIRRGDETEILYQPSYLNGVCDERWTLGYLDG